MVMADSTAAVSSQPLVHHTFMQLDALRDREPLILPICSIHTAATVLATIPGLVLPPLYREAMDDELRQALIARIRACLPCMAASPKYAMQSRDLEVVEVEACDPPAIKLQPGVLALSIDTAVEQHGPHLPLATDSLQCKAVLRQVASQQPGMHIAPPLEYGQLAWGLPIGWSVDLTAPLTRRYVAGYVDALLRAYQPRSLYAVCVHGSKLHHQAIREGLQDSQATSWVFRWLHEPLQAQAWDRGDAHAGSIETVLIEHLAPQLIDHHWWPAQQESLKAHQMSLTAAITATADLPGWIARPDPEWNGIVGDLNNHASLNAASLMQQMVQTALGDVQMLMTSTHTMETAADDR